MLKRYILTASMIFFSFSAAAENHAADGTAAEGEAPVTAAQTYDRAAAEKIFNTSCRACHGNKAQGASSYPKLSDKDPDYLAEKLRIYRAGERIGPNSVLMIQAAKKLSDEDIANISAYVATAFD